VLGYEPTRLDARTHRITVRVNRPNTTVITRTEFKGVPGDADRTTSSSPLAAALAGVLPHADMPLKISALPIVGQGALPDTAALAVVVHVSLDPVSVRRAEGISVDVRVFDPEGRPRAQKSQTAGVTLVPSTNGGEIEVATTFVLKAGQYGVRAATQEQSTGRTGSVYSMVDVPNFWRETVSMSGVFVDSGRRSPFVPTDAFDGLAPVIPTTARTFQAGDSVTAYAQVYRSATASGDMQMQFRIRNDQDNVVQDANSVLPASCFSTIRASGSKASLQMCAYRRPVAVSQLTTGRYLMSITATLRPRATVTREVRFRIR
jgi:hypothetical protein